MAEDTMVKLVRNVINTKYEDLREEDINFAKKALLDCLGIMVAGTSVEDCDLVLEQVKEWGGIEEATMMVYGGKVPLPNAALINNMLARALDLDDVLEAFGTSPEFTDNFGGMTNEELVNGLFEQSFGRDAGEEGLTYYVGLLESGDATLGSIAKQIVDGAQGDDVTFFF